MAIRFIVKQTPVPPAPTPEQQVFMQYSESGDGYVFNTNADWATCRGAATGVESGPAATNEDAAMCAEDQGANFLIGRSHFEFDLTGFTSTGRTIQSIALDLSGFGSNDSTVQVQQSTFSGTVADADFDAFTGGMFLDSPSPWVLFDGGDPARNPMILNSAGQSYVETNFNGSVKLCTREAVYDVGNVEPASSYRCGTYFIEIGNTGLPSGPIRTPRLIITYLKVPDWSVHLDNTDWTVGANGVWNVDKWTTENDTLNLTAGAFASGYKPYKLKLTFTGATSTYVELYNTDGAKNLFRDDEQFFSGVPKVINNYNNLDLDRLDIFNWDSGNFDVTNIEFLEA